MIRFLLILAVTLSSPAHAEPGVAAHALVVGSNAGGPGQAELRYAEDDARRVGALLTELGGYAPASVEIVTHPTPASLRGSLDRFSQRVAADVAAGKQTRVFFYYSGHARATAIDLGPEALPLAELRQKLFASNATLTVVVLDACQSGAFSRVKGAQPTADFSFNSRQSLDAKGVAVLASSTGSELSQESEQLRSSYFTHHLLVGMRGAGDANSDGQVSVDEAYRYAYHQTLLATSATAVGGQHVTLEVDLKGHGEVALSYPRAATASIELPAALEGKVLVQLKRAKAVIAETQKARGAAVRIAVAPGDYEVLVRQGDRLLRCQVTAPGTVEVGRCSNERYVDATRKGGEFQPQWRLAVSAGVGLGEEGLGKDNFRDTLSNFGFTEEGANPTALSLQFTRDLPWLPGTPIGLGLAHKQSPSWSRETDRAPLRFEWTTTTVGAVIRRDLHLTRRLMVGGDLLAGLGIGRTRFIDQDDVVKTESFYGPSFAATAGIGLDNLFTIDGLALWWTYQMAYTPVIENDLGETHDSGGHMLGISVSYSRGGSR